MALSRVKTIEKIHEILTDMDTLLKVGKVREVFIHPEAHTLPATIVRDGLQWLIAIQESFEPVLEIWKLCKPDVWARYFSLGGFDDHAEVMLLRQRLKVLKRTMMHRPVLFLKGKSSAIIKRQNKN